MRNFRTLEIWQLGMNIVKLSYQLIDRLPKNEEFGIKLQMRKSSVSIPSNIAEGCSRKSNKETAHYFEISIGSSFELETQFLLCESIGYLRKEELRIVFSTLDTFQKKANAYLSKL